MNNRITEYAKILVKYSVDVQSGDKVVIEASTVSLPLVREVYRQVLLANANPVLSISDDLCTDIFYQIAEDEQLDFEWSPTIHNIKQADKWITIWGEANTKNLSSIPTEKISRVALAQERINRIFTARTCGYGQKYFMPRVGTQFPCHASAQDAEMSLAQYEDFVYLAAKIGVNDPIKEWEQRREMAKTPNKKII